MRRFAARSLPTPPICCGWVRSSCIPSYRAAATRIGAAVSPVGQAFTEMLRTAPDFGLYQPDGSHPSYFGSCLAAAVHYRTVFGEAPASFGDLELNEAERQAILRVAK